MWLADAGTLVEEFRVTRQLFTSDRVRESTLSPWPLSRDLLFLHKYATFRGVIVQRRQKHTALDKRGDTEEQDSETSMAQRLQSELGA